jgi:hypothetical protein
MLRPLKAMLRPLKAMLRPLKDNVKGVINLSVVLMIGIAFAALIVVAYIIWTIQGQLVTPDTSAAANSSIQNITQGFDNAVNLLLVAITIFILALAVAALLMLRGR